MTGGGSFFCLFCQGYIHLFVFFFLAVSRSGVALCNPSCGNVSLCQHTTARTPRRPTRPTQAQQPQNIIFSRAKCSISVSINPPPMVPLYPHFILSSWWLLITLAFLTASQKDDVLLTMAAEEGCSTARRTNYPCRICGVQAGGYP